MKFIWNKIDGMWDGIYWTMMNMDVYQWGILSTIFVVVGFLALRTRM